MRNKGFSLLEVTIALVIMTAIIAIAIPIMRDAGNTKRTDNLMNQHAREYKILYDASTKWVNENKPTMADSTTVSIAISDLITAGFLPTDFAKRSTAGVVGEALLGGNYALYARKDDLSGSGGPVDAVRVAITEIGILRPPMARKTEVYADIGTAIYKEQTNGYVNRMLQVGQNKHQLVGGLIKSGSTDAVGLRGAFTASLIDFFTANNDRGRPIMFWGFPGINPEVESGGGNQIPSKCNIILPTSNNDAQCPIGSEMVAEWEACWPTLPDIIGVPSLGTAVTVGAYVEEAPHECTGSCSTGGDPISGMRINRTFTVNDSQVAELTCWSAFWHGGYYAGESTSSSLPHGHGLTGYFQSGGGYTQMCSEYDPISRNTYCHPQGQSGFLNQFNSGVFSSAPYYKAKICCED